MIEIKEKIECCGCGACKSICPNKCIDMVSDSEGFLYPILNEKLCIKCGLCSNVCPILKTKEGIVKKDSTPKVYAAINRDEEIRKESSSGGIFSLLAEAVINEKGVVFGAVMTEDCRAVKHTVIEKQSDLFKMRGSKYLQSSLGDCLIKTKKYLDEKRKVLFTGTPCQIEALKSYLREDYDNLICMDLICHGVPSSKVWNQYVNYYEQKEQSHIRSVSFRNKRGGWKQYGMKLNFENGKIYTKVFSEDLYGKAFVQDICFRPSCYLCYFRKKNRESDITVADFWGVENICPEIDDDKGLSLIILHSIKGKKELEKLKDKIILKDIEFSIVEKYNSAMIYSPQMHKRRNNFYRDLEVLEFDKLIKRYIEMPMLPKKFIRNVLKKMGILEYVKQLIKR